MALRARTHVFLLLLACILPMLGFSAFAIVTLSDAEREADKTQSTSTARALSASVDMKLKTGAAALAVLATSESLYSADLSRFYEQCLEIARQHNAWIILADASGQSIFNTRVSLGSPLPRLQLLDLVEAAVRDRAIQISGIFTGGMSGRPQVSIYAPVVRQDQVTHVLIMSLEPDEIRRVLLEQYLPETWRAVVVDRENRVVTRNRVLDRTPVAIVVPALAEQLQATNETSFVAPDESGTILLSTFTKSAYSGWTLVVGIPVSELNAPQRRSLLAIGIAAGVMLLLGVVVAAWIGGRLNRSMGRLSSAALALALGEEAPLTPVRTNVAEINDVMSSLGRASDQLLWRSRERDRAEAALRESEQRFRDIAEVSADSIWEMGPDLRFTSFHGDFYGQHLIDPPTVIGKTRWELVGADPAQDEMWHQHKLDLESHRPFRQFRIISSTKGHRSFLSISGKPVFNEAGTFLGYRGTATNEDAIVEARERAEQAEALLRDAIESIAEGFAIFDANGCLVMQNQRNREIFGGALDHVRPGMTFEQILREGIAKGLYVGAHGQEEEWIAERLNQHRDNSGVMEQRLGNGRWLLITARRMKNGGIASTRMDITAMKQAQAALRESEQRFRDIAEVSADWIWETGPDSRLTHFHGDFQGHDRIDPPDLIGKTVAEILGLDPKTDPAWQKHLLDLEARTPFRRLRVAARVYDRRIFLSISGKPRFGESGEFLGYRGTATDETAIFEVREQVDRAEALLRDAVESSSEGFAIFDPQDRLVMFSDRNREIYGDGLEYMHPGMTFEQILRAGLAKGLYAEAQGREEEWLADRLRQHQEASGIIEQRLSNGRWVLITERRMQNGGMATTRMDITALKEAQAALRESETRLERAQEIAGIGSWELDVATGRYIWSKEMYRIRDLSPETFDPTTDRLAGSIHEDDFPSVHEWLVRLKSGAPQETIEYRTQRPSGEWRIVSLEGRAIPNEAGAITRVAGTLRDITELRHAEQEHRELEQQLQHSQKLEALGVLAGGIAHDLNNALVPIFVTAKLGLKHAGEDARLRREFDLIYQSGVRARDLIKRILAFSRKEAVNRRGFRLDQIIADDLAMLRASTPSTIAIEADIQPVPEIFGEPEQMHQVVINLVTNAVQAVGARLGTISVSLGAAAQGTADSTPFIRLAIRDTGCGMDEATMRRIFEPFFTTKPVGEGTGLGLSMVHGVVTSHGGTIRVESEPGKGTCFTIELPTAATPAESAFASAGAAA